MYIMGIGPGPLECFFDTMSLSTTLQTDTLQQRNNAATYLTNVFQALGDGLSINDFNDVTIDTNDRDRTANAIARIFKEDNSKTANSSASCNQYDVINQPFPPN